MVCKKCQSSIRPSIYFTSIVKSFKREFKHNDDDDDDDADDDDAADDDGDDAKKNSIAAWTYVRTS